MISSLVYTDVGEIARSVLLFLLVIKLRSFYRKTRRTERKNLKKKMNGIWHLYAAMRDISPLL
jgi:hypothetical protein